MRRWRGPARATWLAAAGYLVVALASLYPQSLRPRDTVAYVGDPLESAYLVAWNARALVRAPARVFEANVLHPNRGALAFTDHRLLPSAAVAPLWWATGNGVLAYNAAVLLALLLAAFAARRLALLLTGHALASWAAGALYAFHTYNLNEAPRLNIVSHGFLPLALAELLLLLRTGRRRHAVLVAAFMLLQGLSSNYHLLYGALLLGLVLLAALAARPRATARALPVLLLAGAIAAALFFPVARPYLAAAREHGFTRELPAGIDLAHYVSTAPSNLIYGRMGMEVRQQQRGPHFTGFLPLVLAGLALAAWVCRRGEAAPDPLLPARVWVPAAAVLGLVFVALSLGADAAVMGRRVGPGPYRLVYAVVPGFKLVRIPERLALLAMLFLALLAARGLALLARRWPRAALAAAVLIPLEHLAPPPSPARVPAGRGLPAVYRWLAANPAAAIAEVPPRAEGLVRTETLEMYLSSYHFKRTIHGYTAYPPLITAHLRRLAAQFPAEVALQALQRVGVDTVVVHHGRPLGGDVWHQLSDAPLDAAEKQLRFEQLLRLARLDLYQRLPAAVASGRMALLARFGEGPLFESTADEVYRLRPRAPHPPAPFPRGRRRRDADWTYRAKLEDAARAGDGDRATAWRVRRPLRGDEFLEVTFPRAVPVSGVVLPLRRDSAWPTRFRLAGRDGAGGWAELARFDDAHALQLLDRLLADPRSAAIGFALDGRPLTGVRLMVESGGTGFEGWSVPELEVWTEEP